MINVRLIHLFESKNMISPNKSGFGKGRQTMDPVLHLEDELRKAQVNKDIVGAVCFGDVCFQSAPW